ncbi:MAG TPA: ABC transporter ATP-binding protein, partial [Geobacteraceae bacterium]
MTDARLYIKLDSFSYPDGTVALADIHLAVARGEFCGILGANGSGKTTLLKIMDGLIREYRGQVLLDGQDVLRLHAREIYRTVGLVFQNPDVQLFSPSVADEVAFGPLQLGWPAGEVRDRVAQVLGDMRLSSIADRAPHHLSGGEKTRVEIASVLLMHPEVLLLD